MKNFRFVFKILAASIIAWLVVILLFTSEIALRTGWGTNENQTEQVDVENLSDGKFKRSVQGHNGEMIIRVQIKNQKINEVKVLEHQETKGVGSNAIERIPRQIVESNSTQGIELVSGASVSSQAIIDGVNQIIIEASNQ